MRFNLLLRLKARVYLNDKFETDLMIKITLK